MYFLYCFILNNIKQKHKSSYRWHTVRDELVIESGGKNFLKKGSSPSLRWDAAKPEHYKSSFITVSLQSAIVLVHYTHPKILLVS